MERAPWLINLKRLSFSQKRCLGLSGKLMQDTSMLWPGARIGVAVSGGEDSFVLLLTLLLRKRIVPFNFEVMAIHLNPGFDPVNHLPFLDWARDTGVAAHVELTDHGLKGHSEENKKKSPCVYCSWLRRKRLFNLCQSYGLTHLALGHNADDLVMTFFLNMFQNGRVDGMNANEPFFQGRLRVIRPLLLLPKKTISQARKQWELPIWHNPCPFSEQSKRLDTANWLAERFAKQKGSRTKVFNALTHWQLDKELQKKY